MKKLICFLLFIFTFSFSFAGYLGGGFTVYGDYGTQYKESNQSVSFSWPECDYSYVFHIQADMCSDAGPGNCHCYFQIGWNTYPTRYDPWTIDYYGAGSVDFEDDKYIPKNHDFVYCWVKYSAKINVSTHRYASTCVTVTW
ncbi:MAG: hypothetical protein K9H26_19065 [Prolixibacteraceae bacterium]|nr:hypothetical protein [Prolixibacteraceae bacterium]